MTQEELFSKAKQYIPGGVNSPVRAFGSVGMTPRIIREAHGSHIFDINGTDYIDYVCSWGPMILGHDHPAIRESVIKASEKGLSFGAETKAEIEMAEFICSNVPNIGMVRMVNSGTEAVMSAVRAARGYTGRDKIIKFAGCYHGHSDGMLVKAGSGVMTAGIPDSAGVPAGCTSDTLTAIYNDAESVIQLFRQNPGEIAAVIVEPVGANMGVVPPKKGFLEQLRALCTENKAVLIFDEVITGFRLGFTGAQGYFGIDADLVTYGKIIGAGMPVGAYGGSSAIMETVAPEGPVYQAGTLSGNPVAMAAGYTQLKILKEHPEYYTELEEKGKRLYNGLMQAIPEGRCTVNQAASLGCVFFTAGPVENYTDAKKSDTHEFSKYFRHMLESGFYIAPSQFEAMFVSCAHTNEEIDRTIEAAGEFFRTSAR